MRIKQWLLRYAACFCSILGGVPLSLTAQHSVDFSGYISKYDSTFSGIGPEVYFLPPPKSAEELLDDRYAEKEIDSALVEAYVDRMHYYHRLKMTGDNAVLAKYLPFAETQAASVEGKLLTEIERFEKLGSINLVGDLQNRLAMEYLAIGADAYAIEFFEKAMDTKQRANRMADRDAIGHNLAVTYEYLGQLTEAHTLRDALYERAVETRNADQQGYAMMELAVVKAKQGTAAEAERDIIRKVVPLFRRTRNDEGRIAAYNTLAAIYFLQQKYPEAQWFLLQAKTIADKEGLAGQLPEIIFSLAEVKKQSGNPRVAIEEYKVANGLAQKDNMLGMQLAIQDALGDLYHEAGNYDEAAVALRRYDALKHALFLGASDLPAIN